MGAADYLALCEHFDIIILRNIPKMTVSQKTEARRFITLIDALYDNRVRKEKQIFRKPKNELALLTLSLFLFPPLQVRLICAAATPIGQLFNATPLTTNDDEFKRKLMDDLDLSAVRFLFVFLDAV